MILKTFFRWLWISLAFLIAICVALTVLFTLGIFSVYPFAIIWRDISRRLAVALSVTLLVFGVGAGVAAHLVAKWEHSRQRTLLFDGLAQASTAPTSGRSWRPSSSSGGSGSRCTTGTI